MTVRLVQAIYMDEPSAVFTSSATVMVQVSRPDPCSAHLLFWRRVLRQACLGFIYMMRLSPFSSYTIWLWADFWNSRVSQGCATNPNIGSTGLAKFGGRKRKAQAESIVLNGVTFRYPAMDRRELSETTFPWGCVVLMKGTKYLILPNSAVGKE